MLQCYNSTCRRRGKATEKHFPIQVFQKVRTAGLEGTTTEKELKIMTKPKLVGYLCRVCAKKELRRDAARKSEKSAAVVNTIKGYK